METRRQISTRSLGSLTLTLAPRPAYHRPTSAPKQPMLPPTLVRKVGIHILTWDRRRPLRPPISALLPGQTKPLCVPGYLIHWRAHRLPKATHSLALAQACQVRLLGWLLAWLEQPGTTLTTRATWQSWASPVSWASLVLVSWDRTVDLARRIRSSMCTVLMDRLSPAAPRRRALTGCRFR